MYVQHAPHAKRQRARLAWQRWWCRALTLRQRQHRGLVLLEFLDHVADQLGRHGWHRLFAEQAHVANEVALGHHPRVAEQSKALFTYGEDLHLAVRHAIDAQHARGAAHTLGLGWVAHLATRSNQEHTEQLVSDLAGADHDLVPLFEDAQRQRHAREQHHLLQWEQRQLALVHAHDSRNSSAAPVKISTPISNAPSSKSNVGL